MKHIKTYEGFDFAMIGLSAAAALKIIYNTIKRKNIIKGIKLHDFKKLEYITNQFKDSKTKIGNIIDNDQISQIVYEYGGSDNLIVFTLDKEHNKFIFEWNFSQPVFPFIKFENVDKIEIDIQNEEVIEIQNIFNNLKSQKFKNTDEL